MWLSFLVGCLCVVCMLYLPGSLLLFALLNSIWQSVCLAPAVSLCLFSIVELIYCALGIPCTILTVGAPCAMLCASAIMISHAIDKERSILKLSESSSAEGKRNRARSAFVSLLYLLVGITAVGVYFVLPLDGPGSCFQGYDNVHHMTAIRFCAESGYWSPFFSDSYVAGEQTPYLTSTLYFYPSEWHVLCASLVESLGISVTESINCVNAMLIGFVFPTSIYALLRTLSENDRLVLLFGSLLSVGVAACPWDYAIYGPLYPNMLSMVLVPYVMVSFISMLRSLTARETPRAVQFAIVTFSSLISVVAAHPNGVFTLTALLAPYLTFWIWTELRQMGKGISVRLLSCSGLWALIAAVWALCYRMPAFEGTVVVFWEAVTTPDRAFIDALLLGIIDHPAQPLVFILVALGGAYLLRQRHNRWLLVSYAIAVVMYVLDAGTNSVLKSWITGFWYTDYHRTGAIVGLMAIILAAFGTAALARWLKSALIPTEDTSIGRPSPACARTLMIGYTLCGILLFLPTISIPGIGRIETAFGYQYREFMLQNSLPGDYYDILTYPEQQFGEAAVYLIADGSIIINNPNDGSVFLYGLYNMPVYYRSCYTPSQGYEQPKSTLIRLRLSELSQSSEVQEAVRSLDVEHVYVLQLDHGENRDEKRQFHGIYDPEEWVGINSITEDTEGFTLIFQQNDMRLYEVTL